MAFKNYCRVCLLIDDKHVDVLENEEINIKLQSCLATNITRDDGLPKGICTDCVNTLCKFYDFQLKCQSSERFLKNMKYTINNVKNTTLISSNNDNLSLMYYETSDSFINFLTNDEVMPKRLKSDSGGEISSLVSYLEEEEDTSLKLATKLIQGGVKVTKITSTKKENERSSSNEGYEIHMEIDVLDSDEDIVREILIKESSSNQSIHFNANRNVLPDMNTSSEDKNNFSCLACKKVYHDISLLTDHMKNCKRTCLDCDLLFDSQQKLKQHRLFHRPELDQVCELCGQSFVDNKNLLIHIQNCHSTDCLSELSCVYRCRKCGELFEDKKDLYFHAKKHLQNQTRTKNYECGNCGERFPNKLIMDNHKSGKKCSGLPPSDVPCVFRCKVCLTLFTNRMKLYAHVKKHCDQGPKLCDHCGKSYPNSTALNRHVLTHVGEKFQCQNCLRNFADNTLLEKHLVLHARNDTLICEVCGITFKTQDALFFHIKEKH